MKKAELLENLFINCRKLGEEASYKDGKLLTQPKALLKAILLLPQQLRETKLIDELEISVAQDFISISDGRQKLIGCPRCLRIEPISTRNWTVRFEESVIRNPEGGVIQYLQRKHIYTLHSCGFETADFLAEEFEIVVLDGTIIEYGNYWDLHHHKLLELARANKLRVKVF
ncbi:hypothetical protein [Desulfurobacterium crinifex]